MKCQGVAQVISNALRALDDGGRNYLDIEQERKTQKSGRPVVDQRARFLTIRSAGNFLTSTHGVGAGDDGALAQEASGDEFHSRPTCPRMRQ
jgi:hypothetical protein